MCRFLETSQQRSDESIKTLTEAQAMLEVEIAELRKANEATRRAQDRENLHLERTGVPIVQVNSPERNTYHVIEGSQGPLPSSPTRLQQGAEEQWAVDHFQLGRVLVDGDSGVDILFWKAFQKMGLKESQIRPSVAPILGFNSQRVYPKGAVRLNVVTIERTLPVDFLIVDSVTSYNAIMGRNWIHRMQGVVSTLHQFMRCQLPNSRYTIDIKGCQKRAKKCFLTLKEINNYGTSSPDDNPTK
ncbi:uncharacterized protein LOC133814337 [Humulus lupulus]|uniref:uncharacterized protein LOC133814337 n=1 Tax=Humulus lupulus TaxID=3486 RepID=UPI002B40842A|nr:uncharacterized protein LOC133814337 [Humulus lupulus]